MNRTNLGVGLGFLLLGLMLILSGRGFPAGIGGLPGAGFFPQLIGGLIVALAVALLWEATRGEARELAIENAPQIAGAVGLLFVYLLLWGTGLFALRTVVFLALLLRFLGQEWRAAASVSVVLTTVVTAAFRYGLNVSLE